MLLQDAFGSYSGFVWFDNFHTLFSNGNYRGSFKTTAIFSLLVAVLGLSLSLTLAAFADRVIKGASIYKIFLIWPYAVSPVVVGVLWNFMLSPTLGIVSKLAASLRHRIEWNHVLNWRHAMILIVIAAVWKQVSYNFLFFLAGLQAIPKSLIEAAAIDGAGPVKRFRTIILPLLPPTTFLLLVVNIVYACFHTFAIIEVTTQGGPGKDTEIPRLQGISRRLQGRRSGRRSRPVGGANDHRHRADGGAIQIMWKRKFNTHDSNHE